MEMKWYEYDQNNSGGTWFDDEGVSMLTFVEASSPATANMLFEKHGGYFNGCADGSDCECCGDRWYPQSTLRDAGQTYKETLQGYLDRVDYVANWKDKVKVTAIFHHIDGTKEYYYLGEKLNGYPLRG